MLIRKRKGMYEELEIDVLRYRDINRTVYGNSRCFDSGIILIRRNVSKNETFRKSNLETLLRVFGSLRN